MQASFTPHRGPSLAVWLMSAAAALLSGCLGEPIDLFSDGGQADADVGDAGPGPGDDRLQPDGDIAPQLDADVPDADELTDMDLVEAPADAEPPLEDEGLPLEETDMEPPDEGAPEIPDMEIVGTPPLLFEAFFDGVQLPIDAHGCIGCHEAPGGSGGFGLHRQHPPGSPELRENYESISARCNPNNPTGSTFYLRITTSHFGSEVFTPAEADVILRWIEGE